MASRRVATPRKWQSGKLVCFDVFQVAFGQDEGVEAHLGRFFDAAQGLGERGGYRR